MSRPILLAVVLAATAGMLFGTSRPPHADAATFSPGLIKIERPGHGAGIHASGARIKLKVKGKARLNVKVSGRNVTGKLKLRVVRRKGNIRIVRGTLPRAVVKGPPTTVRFHARTKRLRGSAQVLVQAVRNRPGFLSLKLRRGGNGKAPAVAIARTNTHRIYLTAELNGRPVEDVAEAKRLGVRRLELTATEGLRPGRNVLVVRANDARGNGTVKRRVFRIRRSVILGVRGPDHVRPGVPVRLNAGPSTGGPNRKFIYRWRFSARPAGSKAKIRGAKRQVGRFRPDLPGHYAVRLTVQRRGAGKSGKAASARKGGSSALTVGMDTQLPIDPYGLKLHVDSSRIVIGEKSIDMPTAPGTMVVLPIDELTGMVGRPQTIQPRDVNGARDAQSLTSAIMNRDPDKLLVVAGPPGSADPTIQVGESTWPALHFAQAISALGFDDSYELQTRIVSGGAFALAGSPGNAPGAGVSGAFTGVLDARLRPVGVTKELTGSLGLEQPDFRLLELGDASKPTTVSAINGDTADQVLDAPPLSDGSAIRVTIIDATTLEPKVNATGPATPVQHGLQSVMNLIHQNANDPTKLILFKMKGSAFYENFAEISAISKSLARLGGNRDMFLRSLAIGVNPPGFKNPSFVPYAGSEYVFLGGAGVPQPVEASGAVAGNPLDAVGVMKQDSLGRWTPAATGASKAMDQGLQALAVRAPVAYSYPDNVPGTDRQYAAAERFLFEFLVPGIFCEPGPDCAVVPGIRVNYQNPTMLTSDMLAVALNDLKCNGSIPIPAKAGYTQAQLDALRELICGEITDIQTVHNNLFGPLAALYSDLEADETLDLLSDSDQLLGYLQLKRDADLAKENKFLGISGEAGAILSELVSSAVEAAEVILGPETGGASVLAGKVLSATLGLASSSLGMAGEVESAGGDDDEVAPEQITVGTLAKQIKSALGEASSGLSETESIIVSDPTKLADAVANVAGTNTAKKPIWKLATPLPGLPSDKFKVVDVLRFQQRLAAIQYMLPRMIATVSKPCDVGGSSSDPTTYEAWTALRDDGGGTYLQPQVLRLRSAHLTSKGAKAVGSYLFGPAVPDVAADALTKGPAGAALAPSPFFMTQVAPTSTVNLDTWGHCGEWGPG